MPQRGYAGHMSAQTLQIVVHLPPNLDTEQHADLANAIWAIAPGGSSVEVRGKNVDQVNAAMDERWKDVPEWDTGSKSWVKRSH